MIPLLILRLAAASVSPTVEKRNVAAIFSYKDYPPEALKRGWEGDVTVRVHVGADGRTQSCRVIKSSGHAALDLQTCAIMVSRAGFSPARDKNGHAVEDDFDVPTVHWRIMGSVKAAAT